MKTIVVYFRSLDEVNHPSSKDLQSQLAWSTLAPGEYETAAEIGSSSPSLLSYQDTQTNPLHKLFKNNISLYPFQLPSLIKLLNQDTIKFLHHFDEEDVLINKRIKDNTHLLPNSA